MWFNQKHFQCLDATKLVPHSRGKEALNGADIPSSEWKVEAGTG